MKYIYQLFIILVVTFVGELLHYFIPIPVPASIYGLIIMLILLCTKVVKLEHVERTSDFLIEIMPLMFIPGGVGLVTAWGDLKDMMLPVVVITIISTIVVMAVTGKATELIMKTGKKKEGKIDEEYNDRQHILRCGNQRCGIFDRNIFKKENFGFKSVACINNLCNRGYKDISH